MATRISFVLIGPRAPRSNAITVTTLAMFIVLMTIATSCVREEDITLEQRAHQLAGELMCPICDAQTIDGSSAQISLDMRAKVRELLNEGKTNSEVKDYFVARYGEDILAAPRGGGFNLLAWVVPGFIVLGGIGIALLTVRNMRRSNVSVQATTAPSDDRLADYLAQVDRDLGYASELTSRAPKAEPRTRSNNEEASN